MATDAPAVEISDSVTKATYDEEKARAAKALEENAALKARLEGFEMRDRAQLQSFQPAMQTYIKELTTEFATAENKSHFDSFGDWTRTCHERPNLDSQMQLGTIIHACASKLKRTREEASVQSATADQLAATAKELEAANEDRASKDARIAELSSSLKEIQNNSEKLQLQLEKAGALQEKFDFSKAASREENAEKVDGGVKKSTENASKISALPAFNPLDALSSFINNNASGASSRFTPSIGNHSLLGSASASADSLSSALRPM
jgi:uncharacterized phage infection (PIP) family protein YhgE